MAFSFDKYETIARLLSENSDEESVRTAISRGYYCLFHRARFLSSDSGIGLGSHDRIIRGIANNTGLTDGLRISKMLDDFKQERVNADYYIAPDRHIVFNQNYLKTRFWLRFEMLTQLIEKNRNKKE